MSSCRLLCQAFMQNQKISLEVRTESSHWVDDLRRWKTFEPRIDGDDGNREKFDDDLENFASDPITSISDIPARSIPKQPERPGQSGRL